MILRNILSHSLKRRLIHTNSCLNQSPTIFYNLSYSELFTHESMNNEGEIMKLNNDEIISKVVDLVEKKAKEIQNTKK